jgi:hypothetical protein
VSYTLAFALQLRKKYGKTSVRVAQYKNNEQAQYKKDQNVPINHALYVIKWSCTEPKLITLETALLNAHPAIAVLSHSFLQVLLWFVVWL